MLESYGPDNGNHFLNFGQHGLARGCLGNRFWKSEAREETLPGRCAKVMVLIWGHHLPNFYQRGLARDCLGDHFWKNEPNEKPYQEYVEK